MILGQIERYTIEQLPGRVVIRMRQQRNALGMLGVDRLIAASRPVISLDVDDPAGSAG